MAKYYDEATGQYINTDTGNMTSGTPIGTSQAPAGGDTYSTAGAPGANSKLQQLLGLGALLKKDYTGAGNFLLPQETAEQKNRKVSLRPARQIVDAAMKDTYEGTGPQLIPANLSIKHLGGLGVPTDIKYKKARFALLKQNVVRALQGARMSDTDIAMAVDYVPDITDTPDTIKTKLNVLDEVLKGMMGEE